MHATLSRPAPAPPSLTAAEILLAIRAAIPNLSDDELREIECEAACAYMDRHPPIDADVVDGDTLVAPDDDLFGTEQFSPAIGKTQAA